MNAFVRWGKFNLVGAAGMAVQLGVLALFNKMEPGHYMVGTAAAIEITLIHNFVWHVRYTWRDRFPTLSAKNAERMGHPNVSGGWRDRFPTLNAENAFRMGPPNVRSALAGQLIRFHLSNGLVSMIGNLGLMPIFVEGARIPVLAANAIAILCCSIVNFLLGDRWAFVDARS